MKAHQLSVDLLFDAGGESCFPAREGSTSL